MNETQKMIFGLIQNNQRFVNSSISQIEHMTRRFESDKNEASKTMWGLKLDAQIQDAQKYTDVLSFLWQAFRAAAINDIPGVLQALEIAEQFASQAVNTTEQERRKQHHEANMAWVREHGKAQDNWVKVNVTDEFAAAIPEKYHRKAWGDWGEVFVDQWVGVLAQKYYGGGAEATHEAEVPAEIRRHGRGVLVGGKWYKA